MRLPLATRSFMVVAFIACVGPFASPCAFAQRPELPESDPARTWKEADSNDGRWNESDVGPFLASVLKTPGGNVAKGLSIRVGDKQQAAVAYDTATCSFRAAWTGGFLKFDSRRYGITTAPAIDGTPVFQGHAANDWGEFPSFGKQWRALPVKYRGMYQHGTRSVLSYEIDGVDVLEAPWVELNKGRILLTRTFDIGPRTAHLAVALAPRCGALKVKLSDDFVYFVESEGDEPIVAALKCSDETCQLVQGTRPDLLILPSREPTKLTLMAVRVPREQVGDAAARLKASPPFEDLRELTKPAAPLWPKWIPTGGTLGKGDGPYVIDTVNVPFDNPYKALMFTSGLDFFSSGDIAVSTLHGDVWLVRGVDDDLADVKWKRYATGLCQPLGLKIVDDQVYVLGKDQITRLHDTNGDDEADFYECFNNDGQTSLGGHDFAACLETDPDGNFYYIRAHEGVCRVSADGKSHKSLATGFRNPIGLGVSPDGLVTAAPQEGNWTPSSAIFAIREGGYYGFGGPRKNSKHPLGFDPPLCWMPRSQDNSSGGQVWVTSDKWGLPRNTMLHLSYGLCTALIVMPEQVEDVYQGGTVKLPLFFESGACRGRFSPSDGQLYVCGLMGWQTAAAKDGCLQRVRHTGKPVHMPVGLTVEEDGIAITFNHPLDARSAANADNYYIEQWNYVYSKDYGSKDYRTSDPKKFGRDEVFIDKATLSDDNRTVHLKLEEMARVMQMSVTYQIEAADGAALKNTIYNTINSMTNE